MSAVYGPHVGLKLIIEAFGFAFLIIKIPGT